MNKPGKDAYCRILAKLVITLAAFYLCTTPVFYALILASLKEEGRLYSTLYLACRGIRILTIIAIGFAIRQKRKGIAFEDRQLTKATAFHVGLFCVSLFLQAHKVFLTLYSTVSHLIGVLPRDGLPSFFAVAWSEIFDGNLYWSSLLCLMVVFFHVPDKYFRKAQIRESI